MNEDDLDYTDGQYFEDGGEEMMGFDEYIYDNGQFVPHVPAADRSGTSGQPSRSVPPQHRPPAPRPLFPQAAEVKHESGPLVVHPAVPVTVSQLQRPPIQRRPAPPQNPVVHQLQARPVDYSPPAYYGRPMSKPKPKPVSELQAKAMQEMREQASLNRQKQKNATRKPVAPGQRKPCNCTKSQCLKLYCDCFANGEFCRDCNCKDCHNNITFDGARTKAIRQSLERNPNAFKPKIGIAKAGAADIERLHQKGCHCKKSGCLKNYCECYEAKVPCTDRCKCKGCQNTETYRNSKFKGSGSGSNAITQLSNTAISHTCNDSRSNSVVTDDVQDEFDDIGYPQKPAVEQDPRRLPWFYMTDEVVEAATLCMVAQAEEALNSHHYENKRLTEDEKTVNMEKLILREFGRCLEQIIANASDTSAAGPSGTV